MRNNKVVYGWFADGLPFYIGIGTVKRSQSIKSRNRHCLNKRAKAERENSFEVKILHQNLSWKEACEIEISLISLYGRIDNGTGILTNMTDGGDGRPGAKHSRETKRKMSISQTGRTHTEESKRKMSKSRSGENHPSYGKIFSRETRRKMSLSSSGEKNSMYGKHHSKETKRKISETQKGEKSHNYGIPKSKETKRKMSLANPNCKPIMTPAGRFESCGLASRAIDCSPCTVANRANSDKFPGYYFV